MFFGGFWAAYSDQLFDLIQAYFDARSVDFPQLIQDFGKLKQKLSKIGLIQPKPTPNPEFRQALLKVAENSRKNTEHRFWYLEKLEKNPCGNLVFITYWIEIMQVFMSVTCLTNALCLFGNGG